MYSMDMLEKADAPPIPDGYAMSVSFACLLDVTKSVSTVVTLELEAEEKRADKEAQEEKNKRSQLEMEKEEEEEEEEEDRPKSIECVLAVVDPGKYMITGYVKEHQQTLFVSSTLFFQGQCKGKSALDKSEGGERGARRRRNLQRIDRRV